MNNGNDYSRRILSALRQITHEIDVCSRHLRVEKHITVPQLVCLESLAENKSLTVSDIGRLIHVSNSTVVGILDRLEAKELVKRRRDTTDRRKVIVSITKKGRELVSSSPSPLQEKLSKALAVLPELEQATIALGLEKVTEMMGVPKIVAAPILTSGKLDEDAG